jgi:dTDP-3-amino-3,4,6-trideoxy-alpha-D-glucose transaminase
VSVPFLDLSRQVSALRDELDAVIASVVDEGRFVGGTRVEAFERAFAEYCGAQHAVGVASGTDAITIALLAAGIESGDEVITAANTCVPTVAGIERAGARPVLVDADPGTFTLDPAGLEAALTARTRAIVPVHLYGRCADMDAVCAFAAQHGLAVVEDAAQAHGAELRGRRAGSLGTAAAFSFYPTKNLGALGDAGAVVTNDAELAERVRLLRAYGERARYESVVAGMNSRLDSLQAAVLLAKLPLLDRWNDRRRELAALYTDALDGTGLGLPSAAHEGHVWHMYVVRTRDRRQFRDGLARAGIETLVHYPRAIHEHDAYRHLARERGFPVSERLAREVVSLPLYPELTDADAEAVVAAVRSAAGRTAATSGR